MLSKLSKNVIKKCYQKMLSKLSKNVIKKCYQNMLSKITGISLHNQGNASDE